MKPLASLVALAASRKSIVGLGAILICGAVYFFGHGEVAEKVTFIGAIAGVAATIINAIGNEDAAAKSQPVANITNVNKESDK